MKELGKKKSLLNEHLDNGTFIRQKSYIEKVLKRFYMRKYHI